MIRGKCLASETCFLWVHTQVDNDNGSLVAKIDEIVDDTDGPTKGSFRWTNISSTRRTVYLKSIPLSNPHN